MDAQKEIKNQCIAMKDYAIKMGEIFFDKLLYMSKINMLEENKDKRKELLSQISLGLPLRGNVSTYMYLICTFIFERLLDGKERYTSIEFFKHDISETIDKIESTLLMKNIEYGNSALEPVRIFSNASPVEQINVRLDDKLSRMLNDCDKTIKEDTVFDFMGYLILKMIAEKIVVPERGNDCNGKNYYNHERRVR